MATVLITGGTGLIGKALTKALLAKDYGVIILTRTKPSSAGDPRISYAEWNINAQKIETAAIAGADHLVHLAGAGVADKRWTKKRKKEIVDSRIKSSELLVKAIERIPNHIKTVAGASATGWYGPDGSFSVLGEGRDEDDPPADDFLGQTCRQWEESIGPVIQSGKRLVKLRTGIVLSREGGALQEFEKPLKFGVAAVLGSGRQVISWIHIGDLVRLYIAAIENENMSGVYNAVAPRPVSNKELVMELARAKGRSHISVHVPAFVLRLALGEMSIEVLKSATVSCKKAQATGFSFQYPDIKAAIGDLSR